MEQILDKKVIVTQQFFFLVTRMFIAAITRVLVIKERH